MPTGALAAKGIFWLLAPCVVYRESCFCSVSDGDFLSCVRHLQLHNLGIWIKQARETSQPLPGQGCSRTAALPSRAAKGTRGVPPPVPWGAQSQHSLLQAAQIQVNLKWKLLPSWRFLGFLTGLKTGGTGMGKREVEIAVSSHLKAVPWACCAYPTGEMVGKFLSREKGIGNGHSHSLQLWLCSMEGVE